MSSSFKFTSENQKRLKEILKRYPTKRAAMLPALHMAQAQHGFIPAEAEEYIASLLEVPVVDVREVLSFYSLFSQEPKGKHHLKVCGSLSCWLRGSGEVREYLLEKLGVDEGELTEDGRFSWETVPDCLGACELAPMLQVDGYFEGCLTREKIDGIVKERS